MDISYANSSFEDIEKREKYLNETYFLPKDIPMNIVRVEIMKEYDDQK